jgi:hypothetical protein
MICSSVNRMSAPSGDGLYLKWRSLRGSGHAPTSAEEAATIILDGVRADRWRILVGKDAHRLDELVRESPERGYEPGFFRSFAAETGWPPRHAAPAEGIAETA